MVSVQDPTKTCSTIGATSCTVQGLSNGTSYTFTVTATNGVGTGAASDASSPVIPATVPDAPTNVTATRGNHQLAISWTAPANNGSAITQYTATASPGFKTCTYSVTSPETDTCTITGLTNGTAYSLTVTAISSLGAGQASSPVSATPRTVPTAPRSPMATAGTAKVTLTWSLPKSDGGSTITGYQIYKGKSAGHESAAPLNASLVTSLKYKATSLKQGKTYYFVIRAVNAAGMSHASVEVSATAK